MNDEREPGVNATTTEHDEDLVAHEPQLDAHYETVKQEDRAEAALRRERYIKGLRDFADFLETNKIIPLPVTTFMNVFVHTREEIATIARTTSWEKNYNSNWFALRRTFGDNDDLIFDVNIERSTVCRKVVTGTRIVPASPEREVETVEWVCEEALLAESKE